MNVRHFALNTVLQRLTRANSVMRLVQFGVNVSLTVFALTLVATPATGQQVEVQDPGFRLPRRVRWAAYDPYYAVTSRVYAQAELIRAQGDAAVSFAHARNLNADAYSKELDNWLKEVRVYWDRKRVAEQAKLEREDFRQIARMKYMNDQKWRNNRLWDRLKNHQELSESKIENGDALNFLLARLAPFLPYQFDPETSQFGKEALGQLELDEQVLRNLKLAQGSFKFAADQKVDGSVRFWPYLLRWEEFDESRLSFEDARRTVVEESNLDGQVSVASIRKLQTSLASLANDFHRSEQMKTWVKQRHRYRHFAAADRFLQELDHEILQLEASGDIRPFRGQSNYEPSIDGANVVRLLCFMNRNGVEFAAADSGSEFAYHNLFVMLRSLYLTVAEQDESTSPQKLGELTK